MGKTKDSPKVVELGVGMYNLQQVFKKADPVDFNEGRDYYRDFGARVRQVGAKYGCRVGETACAIYAALSPNNSQENNLRDMARAISTWINEPDNWPHIKLTTYGSNKAKALRILRGEDPDEVLKGLKTNAFFHNLVDFTDLDYVTIDGHMVNAWNNAKVPLDQAGVSSAEYDRIADGVRACAVRLCPSQYQAIIWLTWRRLNRILYKDRNLTLDLQECE